MDQMTEVRGRGSHIAHGGWRRGETSAKRLENTMNKKIMLLAPCTILSALSFLCALLLALCLSADAQQPKKVPRIGYLSSSDAATESVRAEAIRLALRDLSYIEGQNIAIEYRYGEGKVDVDRHSEF